MQINKKKVIYLLIVVSLVYYFLNHKYNIGIPCLFHKITNLYCPGCGITRMIFSIIELDFYQAFRYNPLLFILLICYLIIKLIEIIRKKKIAFKPIYSYYLLFITIIYGILRNIDTFSYLIPTVVK